MSSCVYQKRQLTGTSIDKDRVLLIAKECGVYSVLVYSLFTRGFTEEDVRTILTSSEIPKIELTNCKKAAQTIAQHIKRGSTIKIFADYDCDGITSGYVMFDGLCMANHYYWLNRDFNSKAKIEVKFPNRTDGYGLSIETAKQWVNEKADLVITVDNGITKKEEVTYLRKNNVDVVITDHHEPQRKLLPNDCVIVDPCYNNKEYSDLAGVAVAYIVLQAVYKELKYNLPEFKYLPAVMTGTISDIMPMSIYNALYIKRGLEIVNNADRLQDIPYIYQWFLNNDIGSLDATTTDIAFTLAPRINAASRMDDVKIAGAAFCSKNFKTVERAYNALEKLNEKRKSITQKASKILQSLVIPENDKLIVFNGKDFPKGVHGIIAGEITKQYPDYPAYVYSIKDGICNGSVRCSNDAINVLSLLKEIKSIESYAGHENACVFSVKEENLQNVINEFSQIYDSMYIPQKEKFYDATTSLAMLNDDLLQQINKIPYMPQDLPIFYVPHTLITYVKESQSNPNNIRLKLSDNTSVKYVWAWGFGKKYEQLGKPNKASIICQITQDFMNKKEVKATLKILDIIPE